MEMNNTQQLYLGTYHTVDKINHLINEYRFCDNTVTCTNAL